MNDDLQIPKMCHSFIFTHCKEEIRVLQLICWGDDEPSETPEITVTSMNLTLRQSD